MHYAESAHGIGVAEVATKAASLVAPGAHDREG